MHLENALICGGAGFIGSNLTERLQRAGTRVTVADNLLTGSRENAALAAEFVEIDAASDGFEARFRGTRFDTIFHLGGASSLPLFDDDPNLAHIAIRAFQNNLELARTMDARVAFASTSSFYARCTKPYREDMNVAASTLYEFTKLGMEQLARAYADTYGIDTTALRFFSVYGPREQAKGRLANIVSQFLWCMRHDIPPVIYGDGTQTRDFTHVDDILNGLLTALEHTRGFQAYNIGTGIEHTFNQVIDLLNAALGTGIQPRYIPNPIKNYVRETLADNTKLRALGWEPQIDLKAGIDALVAKERVPPKDRVQALLPA